ncbi:hypothetical protein Vretimale_5792 [Volvox reticuliferus]|uniref:RmlD-like substrate binding domain-containing protein n=1 Tax=Volvox reticuliferus TaxID=1737510 RepID=A0A8J4C640_9CHLO|nr:hypothetical protein Vretifemale_5690 [Volvox reticuliferus]GIM00890.1 hypothetical protein Vretimale_5792 [Volvox reticuliferus]
MSKARQTVLVTGGSGYAGQFLVHALAEVHTVHYTFGTRQLTSAPTTAVAHKVDLATGDGLQEVFDKTAFHVVINCAAISQPGLCESSPDVARAVNVPIHLVNCILRQEQSNGTRAALIHFSTDQVYDGSHAMWREDEPCSPVNTYGKTKLEAEQHILSRLPASFPVAILRSSIIYGPPPPDPVSRALFLQFVASAVRGGALTTFFDDEWRSPVYIRDLERLVSRLIEANAALETRKPTTSDAAGVTAAPTDGVPGSENALFRVAWRQRVFNTGGPERLSRVDMARQVADALNCDYSAILPASTASVNRGVASPADISMDVSRLTEELGFHTTPFNEALREIFPPQPVSAT